MKDGIRVFLAAFPLALAPFWAADRDGWVDVAFSRLLRPGMTITDVDWLMGPPLLHSTMGGGQIGGGGGGGSIDYMYRRVFLTFSADGTLRSISRR